MSRKRKRRRMTPGQKLMLIGAGIYLAAELVDRMRQRSRNPLPPTVPQLEPERIIDVQANVKES